jgi:Ca-activated chloride channel family protein
MSNLGNVALTVCLIVLSGAAVMGQKTPAPDQDVDVVRVNTNLVTVPVSVADRQGRFIAGLNEAQFHLYENGVEQKIAFFDNAESPFTVALLLDTSDSTRSRLAEIQDVALAFIDQLREHDRVLIACFDKQVRILSEATSDRQKLREAIRRAQTGGGTALYSAFASIVNDRLKQISGRKAIVLFTDGVDTSSVSATYESTLYAAQELDALVFPIQYNTYSDMTKNANEATGMQVLTATGERMNVAYERANRYLRALSEGTGGRFNYAGNLKRLSEIFSAIAEELRHQYSIGYYPVRGSGNPERTIKVKVDVPDVSVRARKAFRYRSANERNGGRYSVVAQASRP